MQQEARFRTIVAHIALALLVISSLTSCEYPDPETIILGASCLYSLTDIDNLDFRDGMDEDGFLALDQFRLTPASA